MPSTPRPPSKSFSVAASSRPSSKNAPWPKKCRSRWQVQFNGAGRAIQAEAQRRSPAGGRRPRRARRPRQWRSCGHAPASARRAGRARFVQQRGLVAAAALARAQVTGPAGPRGLGGLFCFGGQGRDRLWPSPSARPPAPGSGDGQSPSSALKPMVTPSAGASVLVDHRLGVLQGQPGQRPSARLAVAGHVLVGRRRVAQGLRGARQFAAHGLVDPAPALRQRIGAGAVEGKHGVQAGRQRAGGTDCCATGGALGPRGPGASPSTGRIFTSRANCRPVDSALTASAATSCALRVQVVGGPGRGELAAEIAFGAPGLRQSREMPDTLADTARA